MGGAEGGVGSLPEGAAVSEKLTDRTLGEVALNPDGNTYNGYAAIRWMYEAVTGNPLDADGALDIVSRARVLAAKRKKEGSAK